MKLLKMVNGEVDILPEALNITAFKDLYKRDKKTGLQEFSLLYFMYDPRSEFMVEVDEDARLTRVIEALGITKWKSDEVFKKASKQYIELCETTSTKTLKVNKKLIDKISKYLDAVEIDADNLTQITKAISDMNKLALELNKAEIEISAALESTDDLFSNGQLALGDVIN